MILQKLPLHLIIKTIISSAQKMEFLKKSLMENVIFCAVKGLEFESL